MDDLFAWLDNDYYDYYSYDNYGYEAVDYNSYFSNTQKKQASSLNRNPNKVRKSSSSSSTKIRSYPCGGSTPGMFTRTQAYKDFIQDDELFMKSFEPSSEINLINGGIPSDEFRRLVLNDKSSDQNTTNIQMESLTTDLADAQKELNIYTILQNHGCYCSNMFNQHKRFPTGGLPVDDLDKICQLWWMCRRCNKINGICDMNNSNNSSYIAKIQDSTGNILSCKDDRNTQCGTNHCECDKKFLQNIKELVLLFYNGEVPPSKPCHNSKSKDKQYKKCCGVSPTWVTYSEKRYECVVNEFGYEVLRWKRPG